MVWLYDGEGLGIIALQVNNLKPFIYNGTQVYNCFPGVD